MSLWAEYKKEREGKSVLEWKDAFTVYSYPGEGLCYVEDVYVKPKLRKSGLGRAMVEEIKKEAK